MIKLKDLLFEVTTREAIADIVRQERYKPLTDTQYNELEEEYLDPATSDSRKEQIKRKMIETMYSKAARVAAQRAPKVGISYEDAFQAAAYGLEKAFQTYRWNEHWRQAAATGMYGYIGKEGYDTKSAVKVPMNAQQQLAADKAAADLEFKRTGRSQEPEPLAQMSSITGPENDELEYLYGKGELEDKGDEGVYSIPDESEGASDTEIRVRIYFDGLRNQANTAAQKNRINQAQTFLYHLAGFGDYDQLDPIEIANEFDVTPETVHNRLTTYAPFYREIY